jgi:hypothetical protein
MYIMAGILAMDSLVWWCCNQVFLRIFSAIAYMRTFYFIKSYTHYQTIPLPYCRYMDILYCSMCIIETQLSSLLLYIRSDLKGPMPGCLPAIMYRVSSLYYLCDLYGLNQLGGMYRIGNIIGFFLGEVTGNVKSRQYNRNESRDFMVYYMNPSAWFYLP